MRSRGLNEMCVVALFAASGLPVVARGDIDPNSGIDLVRIGAVGNAPWMGGPIGGDQAIGRGGVNYAYSIGRFEVTTAQWAEFYNAAFDRPAPLNIPFLQGPQIWGAVQTAAQNGGFRWSVPAGHEMYPVGGITWRTAAIYCNWLENNKSPAPSAFTNGAYDVSTFGDLGQSFADQVAHNASSRYWIPTLDEHIKASHYDPNKNGPGQGGYWLYNITSDTPPISAPPPSLGGNGQVNGPWSSAMYPGVDTFSIPLGAYETTSPWGLCDTGGATTEWTETPWGEGTVYARRYLDGSSWALGPLGQDSITRLEIERPGLLAYPFGIRIASSVPSPASCSLFLTTSIFWSRRPRRMADAKPARVRRRSAHVPRSCGPDERGHRNC